jgi:hypothetical protein
MKKFFKALSLVLALTLIIGTIPVQAATGEFEIIKGRTDWKIYLDGAKGQKEDGTVCKTKDRYKLSKLVVGFDKETMDIKLESADKSIATVSSKKDKVYAKSIGTTTVTIYVYDIETEKLLGNLDIDIVVKKNATEIKYFVTDAEGNDVDLENKLAVNVPYTVTLTRRGEEDLDGDGKGDIVDTDYRVLTCEDDAVLIEKANKYGTEYTVTFTKAGKFTLKAGSYQSKLFPALLLSEDIEVVAGYDAVAVAQSGLASADVTFETNVVGLTNDAFKAYYLVGETKIYPSNVKSVVCTDNVATVTFLSNFIQGIEYFVEYDGTLVGSFTTAVITADSVVAIEIPAQQFEAGVSDQKLQYKLLNADGIDIKELLGSTLNGVLSFEIVNGDVDTYITSGQEPVIYIGTADKAYKVKATYTWVNSTGDTKKVEGEGNVVSVKPAQWEMGTVTGIVASINAGDYIGADGKIDSNVKAMTTWTMDDATSGAALQIAVPFTKNGTTVYEGFGKQAGVNKFAGYVVKAADETVVMVDALNNGQKWGLTANKPGTTTLLVYGQPIGGGADVVIGAIPVEVKAKREAKTLTVTPNKNTLNTAYAGDEIEFTVTIKDQYDEEMKWTAANNLTYTVAKSNENDNGPVFKWYDYLTDDYYTSYTEDAGYKFYLDGDDVTIPASAKTKTLNLKFTSGNLSQVVYISCDDDPVATSYVLKLTSNTLDTAVKGDTTSAYTYIYLEGKNKSGYAAQGKTFLDLDFVDATPKTEKTVSGAALGEKFVYTISKDGAVKKASELKNFDDFFNTFDAVDTGVSGEAIKMDKGTYTITAYKITTDATNSIVTVVGTQVLTVEDKQIMPTVTKKANAERLPAINDATVASAFDVQFSGGAVTCEYIYTVNGGGNTAYVASVNVKILNSYVGNFVINLPIDTLVKVGS